MMKRTTDRETIFEIGLIALGITMVLGLAVFVLGKTIGGVRRRARHAEQPPEQGSIPTGQHQNIKAAAPR